MVPVITITIYWGAGEWDGSRSLHDMLDIKNKELLEYVPNYWLNECINTNINISEEEGDEADMCKGIKDLMEEAREEGREEGADRLAILIKYLSKDNRRKEQDKILSDKQLREQLYSEYNL